MANVGRNDPCPCGSGNKHKKCCLGAAQEDAAKRMRAAHDEKKLLEFERKNLEARRKIDAALARGAELQWLDDGLDELSNSVLHLIKEQRFDEALAVCQRLLDEYPDVADGMHRSATVHYAMGNYAVAADFWQRTLHFIEHPEERPFYDPEVFDDYRHRIAEARQRAAEIEAAASQVAPTAAEDHAR